MEEGLKILNDIGFRENLCKSFFMQQEVEHLEFLLTSDGVKPHQKKVEAKKRIKSFTNLKQLKQFLGIINFYQNIWKRILNILVPLCKLSSKLVNYIESGEN